MIPVDLITGFLGAGKTTFLLRYAAYLADQGKRLGILTYDHGALNVDLPLLRALSARGCTIETIAGGCDADCHRRRFRTRLIEMGMAGYDRIVIEPSGVFDLDEFFDTLAEPPLDRKFEIGSVIAIVDALPDRETSAEEDFFLASQAAGAGAIVLSRTQLADAEEIAETVAHLRRAAAAIRAELPGDGAIITKPWDELTETDLAALSRCGHGAPDYVKTVSTEALSIQSLPYLNLPLGRQALTARVAALFASSTYGKILRVKGFFEEDGLWYQLNATRDTTRIESVPPTRAALLVIGSALREDAIGELLTGQKPQLHIL